MFEISILLARQNDFLALLERSYVAAISPPPGNLFPLTESRFRFGEHGINGPFLSARLTSGPFVEGLLNLSARLVSHSTRLLSRCSTSSLPPRGVSQAHGRSISLVFFFLLDPLAMALLPDLYDMKGLQPSFTRPTSECHPMAFCWWQNSLSSFSWPPPQLQVDIVSMSFFPRCFPAGLSPKVEGNRVCASFVSPSLFFFPNSV